MQFDQFPPYESCEMLLVCFGDACVSRVDTKKKLHRHTTYLEKLFHFPIMLLPSVKSFHDLDIRKKGVHHRFDLKLKLSLVGKCAHDGHLSIFRFVFHMCKKAWCSIHQLHQGGYFQFGLGSGLMKFAGWLVGWPVAMHCLHVCTAAQGKDVI
jgi:hypothetical protein